MYSAASQVPQKNDALSDGLLESWVGMQQIRVNCYRAFHSADQVQDHNALLKSMHIQRVKSSCLRVGSNLGSPTALSATATGHGYIGLDCELSVRRML